MSDRRLNQSINPDPRISRQIFVIPGDVEKLVEMGFTRENAELGLQLTFGDMNAAIEWCSKH